MRHWQSDLDDRWRLFTQPKPRQPSVESAFLCGRDDSTTGAGRRNPAGQSVDCAGRSSPQPNASGINASSTAALARLCNRAADNTVPLATTGLLQWRPYKRQCCPAGGNKWHQCGCDGWSTPALRSFEQPRRQWRNSADQTQQIAGPAGNASVLDNEDAGFVDAASRSGRTVHAQYRPFDTLVRSQSPAAARSASQYFGDGAE